MVLWYYGVMVLWYFGIMVLWCHDSGSGTYVDNFQWARAKQIFQAEWAQGRIPSETLG